MTFHNADTGFAVLKVKARGRRDLVPVVGNAASIGAGEYIHAVGTWLTDRTHGLQFKARGRRDLVPVVGNAASIDAGEYIHAVGTWLTDRTHGLQFKADLLKTTPPTTTEGIARYLGSGMVRGIGAKLAERIVA